MEGLGWASRAWYWGGGLRVSLKGQGRLGMGKEGLIWVSFHSFIGKQLFTHKSRTLENMPPTRAALDQHIKRVAYQANVWCKALEPDPQLPSPSDWGWVKDEVGWQPLWTTLPEASQSCYEIIRCGCKKGCTKRCSCKKAALKCTALCLCSGDC